jgi:hypothetical protein
VRREIVPAPAETGVEWRGWHASRGGLATTLHQLPVDDKAIQAKFQNDSSGNDLVTGEQ